jgi:hypothetical protein
MPSRLREELGGPFVDAHPRYDDAIGDASINPPAAHNAATDEPAARQGRCAQIHLPTGSMCTRGRGHAASCTFKTARPAGQVQPDLD